MTSDEMTLGRLGVGSIVMQREPWCWAWPLTLSAQQQPSRTHRLHDTPSPSPAFVTQRCLQPSPTCRKFLIPLRFFL